MTVLLGLGANIGDRIANLQQALTRIQKIPELRVTKISPLYVSDAMLPENAPAQWAEPYLNATLACETTLQPDALLHALKQIETDMGRELAGPHWSPRRIDIDILAWDDLQLATPVLTIPHRGLLTRPFALWPLADIAPFWVHPQNGQTAAQLVEAWGSRFGDQAPFHTRQINQRLETPALVGIVNVTPDSFSDGNLCLAAEAALDHCRTLIADGASIIDIGAESTAPRATAITPAEEWARLAPLLDLLLPARHKFLITPKISIDTRHAEVAEKALARGVDWINDVSGLDDPAMRHLIKEARVDCVIMHHLCIPERRTQVLPRNQHPTPFVLAWGEKRLNELEKQGIAREKIIFDPGIGFGKMAEQSLAVLQTIQAFQQLGTRLLVGHSRKTCLSLLNNLAFAERDIETMAITLMLAKQGIDYVRVHNVNYSARGIKTMAALAP